MNDEGSSREINWTTSNVPDFSSVLSQKLQSKKENSTTSGFDPYQMMVNKKDIDSGKSVDISNIQKWPEEDVKKLEDFCKKYGILGFNFGHMHPLAALTMLKSKVGVVDDDMEKRVPIGYESMIKKKMVLFD